MKTLTTLLFASLAVAACQLAQPPAEPGLPSEPADPGDPRPVVLHAAPRIQEGPLGTIEWRPDLGAWLAARTEASGDPDESDRFEESAAGGLGNAGPASPASPGAVAGAELQALGYTDSNSDSPFDSGLDLEEEYEEQLGEDLMAVGGQFYLGGGGGALGDEPVLRDAEVASRGRSAVAKAGSPDPQTDVTWQRATAGGNSIAIFVGDEDKLPLDGIEARAWVDGMRARVLLDCVFTNDRQQQLEGNFKLRLPEGATPYYLAFGEDVLADGSDGLASLGDRSSWQGPEPEQVLGAREGRWQGAREARMVPRGQAARAYKAEVRRSVDPALLEWAGAGIFQARLFPLLPGARHRVVVGYELDLAAVPGTPDTYELQLSFPEDLARLGLELAVLTPPGVEAELLDPALATESWTAGERGVLAWPATDVRAFRLRVDLGAELGPAALVSGADGGYFALDLDPGLEAPRSGAGGGARTAIFALDTSLSAADTFATQLDLLEAILEQNRGQLDEFAVLFFDVTPRWWRPGLAPNDRATVERLLADCAGRSLEGATDLAAALAAAARPSWAPGLGGAGQAWDLFLLSDGAATWGPAEHRAIGASLRPGRDSLTGPLFAYTLGATGTDRSALEFLTRETGGALFSVGGPADLERAASAHHGAPWTIEGLSLGGASDLVLRGRPNAVFPGQRLRLVGRGRPAVGDVLRLDLAQGGLRRTVELPLARTLESPLAARAYGVVATPQLEEFGRETRAAAEAFATHFRVAGKAASLLMLEDEAAYARQGVLQDADLELARTASASQLVAAALARLAGALDDPALRLFELLEPLAEGGGLGEVPLAPRWGSGLGLGDPMTGDRRDPGAQEGRPGPVVVEAPAPLATLVLPPEFAAAIATLPASALTVGAGDLTALPLAAVWAEDVPSALREALASGEPAYDLVQVEAAERLATLGLGDAVRLLSCLIELNPGDGVFARDVAQTLTGWGLHGHAYHLLLRVAEQRPFEPQSYLSLARAAEELGKGDLAMFWYTVSLSGKWEARFGDFHQIAAFDAMHFLRRAARGEVEVLGRGWLDVGMPGLAEAVTPISLAEQLELAVAIQWNTDGTDIDLHVIDPLMEHCYYGHRDTAAGGHLSQDVTQGYGPELFTLPLMDEGETIVYARFFASNPNRTSVRTKVLATLYQNWGAADEVVERRVIELEEADQQHGLLKLTVR